MRKKTVLTIALAGVALLPGITQAFDPLDTSNSYDYVVLTNEDFATQAESFIGLHPALRSCLIRLGEVQAAFPQGTRADAIRAFVVYAYQNWKVPPSYVLLVGDAHNTYAPYDFVTTMNGENPYYSWFGSSTYANDGYFVGPVVVGQQKPIMHIGRIPARTTTDVSNVYTKTYNYQQSSGNAAWLQKILLLVGDANINDGPPDPPNSTYRTLNNLLKANELQGWNQSNITTYYAQDYINASDDTKTAVTRNAWNAGYGFVNALGNTLDIDWLVFMADFNLPGYNGGTGSPTFTGSLSSTGYVPVVFGNTCFTNQFHLDLDLTIGEDLLLTSPTKGAVAIVAPTQQVDMVEAYALDQTFVHEMITNGVRNLGRLYSTAKSTFVTQRQGHPIFADQFALLGDPALDVRLGTPPAPTSYVSSAEIEDAPILQNTLVAKTADITQDNLRVVNEAVGVTPLVGERMIKVKAHDALGTLASAEWKIQSVSLPVTQNMILSFWMNLSASPGGNGKIVIDGNTSAGRIKDRVDIFDQDGRPLDAKQRAATDAGWKFYYADLSPLQGATLQDLRVRYESTSPADSGTLVAYFDDIRVARYDSPQSQDLVNRSFEEDEDGNGTPDFWTNLGGEASTLNALRSDDFAFDGTYSLLVQDIYANGEGARQVFTANLETLGYNFSLRYYSAVSTTFHARLRNLLTGSVLWDQGCSSTNTWQTTGYVFQTPQYGQPVRYSLEIVPSDPSTPVYVDHVLMYPAVLVGVDRRSIPDEGAAIASVTPNPVPFGMPLRVEFRVPREADVEFGLFDAGGRRVTGSQSQRVFPGSHDLMIPSGAAGVPAGMYFLRVRVNGWWISEARKVVRLR